MHWKDFLYFQKNSKTAVLLLLVLIVLTFILNVLLGNRRSSDIALRENDSLLREFEEFKKTLTVNEAPITATEVRKTTRAGWGNTHGGKGEGGSASNEETDSPQYSAASAYPAREKLSEGETIPLNETDTAQWKKIPGIGSAYASRIVKYHDLLGGYVRPEQLLEVYGMDEELFGRMVVYIEPDGNFRRLKINRSEFKELLRHPYLNYKQVQAVMKLRQKKGDITSIRELSLLDDFTAEDIARLEPYLEF